MRRTAIIAALPGELKQLVQAGWIRYPGFAAPVQVWTKISGDQQWIAACAGMGKAAATRAFAAANAVGKLDAVLSVGWAGGLTGSCHAGQLLIPDVVVDSQTGERFMLAENGRNCILVTTPGVAGAQEKARLASAYGACMVDMEAATVLRLAQGMGVPACCLKVITDDSTANLPDLQRFIDSNGQMQMAKFVGHVLLRPQYWKTLVQLGNASSAASHPLASAIYNILSNASIDVNELNRTGVLPE